jgi:hypothetical protein
VSCFLQQWVAHRKTGQYWRVNHTKTDSVESVEADCEEEQADEERSTRLEEACRDPDMAELLCMEDEEEHRLANEANANACLPDKLEHDEKSVRFLHADYSLELSFWRYGSFLCRKVCTG